jgi:signal transduction histidine kinase
MGARAWSPRAEELITASVPVAALVLAVATIAALGRDSEVITRLPQVSPVLEGLGIVAGLLTTLAGALTWMAGRRSIGLSAMLAAICWFGADWAGNPAAPAALRGAGLVAATLTLPALGWTVAATRPDRLSRLTRSVLLAAAAGLATLAVLWLIAWIPPLDPRCLAICDANPLGAGVDFRLARSLANAWQGLTVALGLGLAAWALRGLATATAPARRQRGALLVGALLVGAAWAAWGLSLMLPSTLVAPTGAIGAALFAGRGLAMIVFAAGLGWLTFNAQQTLAAIRRLADRLAPFPGGGTLEVGLGEALADPRLRLIYALPGDGRFVRADGQLAEIDLSALAPDQLTEIRKGDEVVAIAIRSPEAAAEPVAAEFGAAVQLAADNERLLASVRHDVIELRASRTRIVETGDAERRRLERNLHDGAQQRMLGIVGDLATARDAANAAGDPRADILERAVTEADDTIAALRALARGIHPAILEEAGVAAALEALADEAAIPMVIEEAPEARFDQATESAVWRLISQCLGDGARLDATSLRVAITQDDVRLDVRVDVEDIAEPIDTTGLEDAIGAAGGTLVTSAPAPGTMRISASIPCA